VPAPQRRKARQTPRRLAEAIDDLDLEISDALRAVHQGPQGLRRGCEFALWIRTARAPYEGGIEHQLAACSSSRPVTAQVAAAMERSEQRQVAAARR